MKMEGVSGPSKPENSSTPYQRTSFNGQSYTLLDENMDDVLVNTNILRPSMEQ